MYIKTDKFQDIYEFMLENSIAIRMFNGYLRVTAGTEAENAEFMAVLEKYLSR